jgi:hypothetical protein
MSTRVVTEGEYPGIEAGTEIRVRIDPRTGSITDVVGPNNRPVVSDVAKRPPAGSPHYESDSEGYLITVQGGRAERVTDRDGQPVRVKSKNAAGEVVEVEVGGKTLRVTPGQALDYYGQIGKREEEREGKVRSLQQAEQDEQENLSQRAAATKVLNDLRAKKQALRPASVDPSTGKITDDSYWAQVDDLDAQIKDAEYEVRRRQELADEAGKEARRLRGQATSSKPTFSGAVEAFRKQAGREPTATELENLKKHYEP